MDKIFEMLTENTGVAMGDSGMAYGRHWQRNQGRDFDGEPIGRLSFWGNDGDEARPDVTLSVYHFLHQALTYAPEMDKRYQEFAAERRADDYELSIMEAFTDHLREEGGDIGGIYGDGDPFTVNTYNGEDLLSQTLQYRYFTYNDESFVLLQIHGGCDVRGGYTDAVAFYAGDDGTWIIDNAKATIYADGDKAFNGDPYWYTDDGWHWYFEGSTAGRNLESYKLSHDPAHKGDGEHVYIDEDERAHCPITGSLLKVTF